MLHKYLREDQESKHMVWEAYSKFNFLSLSDAGFSVELVAL